MIKDKKIRSTEILHLMKSIRFLLLYLECSQINHLELSKYFKKAKSYEKIYFWKLMKLVKNQDMQKKIFMKVMKRCINFF